MEVQSWGAWGRGGIGEEKRDEDKNKKIYIQYYY